MVKGKFIKKMLVSMVACGALLAANLVAFAGSEYSQGSGTAGSTKLTAEVGFSGQTAYARVSATSYVDARMRGDVYYINPSGSAVLSGAFDQRSYGDTSCKCDGEIIKVNCNFDVYSDDGEWHHHLCAE